MITGAVGPVVVVVMTTGAVGPVVVVVLVGAAQALRARPNARDVIIIARRISSLLVGSRICGERLLTLTLSIAANRGDLVETRWSDAPDLR